VAERKRRACEALEMVGLGDRMDHQPTEAGAEVMDILHRLHRERGITIVMVTHDDEIGAQAERIVRLRDGMIVSQEGGATHFPSASHLEEEVES